VEFLVDHEGAFYFMEMNTRLQVEHPVTEMITGRDLVEWQLRVAAGLPLPLAQDGIKMRGHAIEARIYAENPAHDFLPSIGRLIHLRFPSASARVRIDTGVEEGDTITPFYDPMIAKLIVWSETRELALAKMTHALGETEIVGVANNVGFLERLISSPSFTSAQLDTSLIEREHEWINAAEDEPEDALFALAALAIIERESKAEAVDSPWALRDGWRLGGRYARTLEFECGERPKSVQVEYGERNYRMNIGDSSLAVRGGAESDGSIAALVDGRRRSARVIAAGAKLHIFIEGKRFVIEYHDPLDVELEHVGKESSFLAPMPGRVIAQSVEPGAKVERGAALMVLEAMKMECTIHAPAAGSVEAFLFNVGDQVTEGAELLRFARAEKEGN
jgi:3-methylcrotonyl-CoA carboxylase alpha subunit